MQHLALKFKISAQSLQLIYGILCFKKWNIFHKLCSCLHHNRYLGSISLKVHRRAITFIVILYGIIILKSRRREIIIISVDEIDKLYLINIVYMYIIFCFFLVFQLIWFVWFIVEVIFHVHYTMKSRKGYSTI